MQIDPTVMICGLRPAALKHLLRLVHINVVSAAKRLSLSKSEALAVLTQLEAEGWLTKIEGSWHPTDQAARLSATPLLKRLPVDDAYLVLGRLIEEVQAINLDPSHSYLVAELIVFGSLLVSAPGTSVGDIDVAVVTGVRENDPARRDVLRGREVMAAPSDYGGVRLQLWPRERLIRRLRRIDRRISIHEAEEAKIFPHHVVYALDSTTRRETISPLPKA